ncbi:MAG: response regulator [Actinomycetota bacterium]
MGDSTAAGTFTSRDPIRARRVLVVDDDAAIRRLIRRALSTDGIEVDVACEGYEGLRLAHATAYDVILLDLQMPDLGGMAILPRLLWARPDQAVVIFSCRSDPATQRECLSAGARAFLAKPFSLADLSMSISDAFAGARGVA